jgi:transposase
VAVGGVITVRSLKRSRGGSGRVARGGTCLKTWWAWQTAWKRHRRWSVDGTYAEIFAAVRRAHSIDTADLDAGVGEAVVGELHQRARTSTRGRRSI